MMSMFRVALVFAVTSVFPWQNSFSLCAALFCTSMYKMKLILYIVQCSSAQVIQRPDHFWCAICVSTSNGCASIVRMMLQVWGTLSSHSWAFSSASAALRLVWSCVVKGVGLAELFSSGWGVCQSGQGKLASNQDSSSHLSLSCFRSKQAGTCFPQLSPGFPHPFY